MSHAKSSASQREDIRDHEGVKFYKDDEGFLEFCDEHHMDDGDEVVSKWEERMEGKRKWRDVYMKLYYWEGKEPDHSEFEALEKLYEVVKKREIYLSDQCCRYLKLLEGINSRCTKIVRDIKKEGVFDDHICGVCFDQSM
jgi:hypothetical protein